MTRAVQLGAACVVLIAAAGQARAGLITIDPDPASEITLGAFDAGADDDSFFPVGIPAQDFLIADTHMGASGSTAIDLSEQSGQTLFAIEFTHIYSGEFGEELVRTSGTLFFTAQQDSVYELSGFYNLTGSNLVQFHVFFDDITSATNQLFGNSQSSNNVVDQMFDLESSDEENSIVPTGSPMGTLFAGHRYNLSFQYLIQLSGEPISGAGASAEGELNLRITQTHNPVPEPSSLALFGIGACVSGLGAVRRRARYPNRRRLRCWGSGCA